MSILENIKKGQVWNSPKTPLMLQFEKETGFKAVLVNGKITGRFERWLFKKGLKTSNFSEAKKNKRISEAKKAENLSDKTRRKMSISKSGENNPMYGKIGPNHGKFGKDSSAYKENIGYSAIHKRAGKVDPKPKDGICKLCGKVFDKFGYTKLVHSNKNHTYNLPINPDEWQWVHESCHKKYDIEKGFRKVKK